MRKHLSLSLLRLAGDAKMISDLQAKMPIKIREKYKKDLVDDDNASAYLFELHIAWHFHRKGYEVSWYEEDGKPEYCVTNKDFALDVECKRIGKDAFKKIRRRDFYRFAEMLIPQISDNKLQGNIEVELHDKFHANNQFIEDLCNRVLTEIKTHDGKGIVNIHEGVLSLNLREQSNSLVDQETVLKTIDEWKSKGGHAAIFMEGDEEHRTNPITVAIKSRKRNNVLIGIKDKIKWVAKNQLEPSRPGVIVCFLETVTTSDLNILRTNSGLQYMSSYVLNKSEHEHIAALIFCGEKAVTSEENTILSSADALMFRNPHCTFEQAKDFSFF